MSEFAAESLDAFREIPEGTFDAFQQSLAENPDIAKDLYAQLLQTNPRLALRILQQAQSAESPSSYWEGVHNLLGPLAHFAGDKLLERYFEADATEEQKAV